MRLIAYLMHATLLFVLSLYLVFIARACEPVFLARGGNRQTTFLLYCSVLPLLLASFYFRLMLGHKGINLLKEVLIVSIGITLLLFLITTYVLAGLT